MFSLASTIQSINKCFCASESTELGIGVFLPQLRFVNHWCFCNGGCSLATSREQDSQPALFSALDRNRRAPLGLKKAKGGSSDPKEGLPFEGAGFLLVGGFSREKTQIGKLHWETKKLLQVNSWLAGRQQFIVQKKRCQNQISKGKVFSFDSWYERFLSFVTTLPKAFTHGA